MDRRIHGVNQKPKTLAMLIHIFFEGNVYWMISVHPASPSCSIMAMNDFGSKSFTLPTAWPVVVLWKTNTYVCNLPACSQIWYLYILYTHYVHIIYIYILYMLHTHTHIYIYKIHVTYMMIHTYTVYIYIWVNYSISLT